MDGWTQLCRHNVCATRSHAHGRRTKTKRNHCTSRALDDRRRRPRRKLPVCCNQHKRGMHTQIAGEHHPNVGQYHLLAGDEPPRVAVQKLDV